MDFTELNKDAFLSVRDLVVEYRSEGKTVHAVNGVSFDLERGKTIGLVGETGAGKHPLQRPCCAFCRTIPPSGRTAVCGWMGRRSCPFPRKKCRSSGAI